ncbi:MAG: hypothetical protein IPJ67_01015 [Candidatus Moraniibacteriota bacterium]|nr:MAG: hypothetical protein IPJ67_01015 [Candidatus Moranbacteria bacterium]
MNRFENPTPPKESREENTLPQEVSKEKSPEKFSHQLAEHITGLKLNDPTFLDRLIQDQNIIRSKYRLPQRDMRFDQPSEYEKMLREMAKNSNVAIRSKSECGKFFAENHAAGGVFLPESNKIGIDINRNDLETYSKNLGTFEHELIHAFQENQSSGMPIELMEYEAYIAGFNLQFLNGKRKEGGNVEEYLDTMFNMIGGSVGIWYKSQSKGRDTPLEPKWYKKD